MQNNRALYPKRAIGPTGTTIASQTLTVTGTAQLPTGYTATPAVNGVTLVTFDVAGGDVRVWWDGQTPTSTTGHTLPASTAYTWDVVQYNNALFILDSTATTATISASPMTI